MISGREKALKEILSIKNSNILCELPTSFGKSKIALYLINKSKNKSKILIVIPRLVLIQNWKDEFKKWGFESLLSNVEFVTYVSFPKKAGIWDIIIFDEVHHLSPRCREALEDFRIKQSIMLSATVTPKMKQELKYRFKDLFIYSISTKQAIEDEVLADPTVYLIPLLLDNQRKSYTIVKNPKCKKSITIDYKERWKYSKVKNVKIIITCTQRQYYDDLSSLISWYKKRNYSIAFQNLFLRKSGERLKWLSNLKTSYIKEILEHLKDYRTLTFCNGIAQTEELGRYCINSKNKESQENLSKFNTQKINHITACNMIDEGMNLVNCRVGIYASLNSSERMIKQKLGRILRHKKPVIIIPYYKNTRDEEIVQRMLEDYNSKLVKTITDFSEINLYAKCQ